MEHKQDWGDSACPPKTPCIVGWVFGIVVFALVAFMPGVFNDGDTFSHIAAGDWMLAHHAVPHADPFSYTKLGQPWVVHEWLSEILFAGAYRFLHWQGVVLLTAAAAGLAVAQLGRHLECFLAPGPVALLLVLTVACLSPSLLARPHVLALPVFEAWAAALFIARAEKRAPPWLLLPLMVLWANLHGGYMLGLALLFPLGLEAIFAEPERWRPVLLRWGGFALASVVAAACTPAGLAGLLLPFKLTGVPELSLVGEWQPTDFATLQPLELILIAGLYLALSRGARLPPIRLLLILGLLHMALRHTRHLVLIGLLFPLLIAEPLDASLQERKSAPVGAAWRVAAAGLACALLALRLYLPLVRHDGPSAPMSALAQVPAALASTHVLNDYSFGGYLIFNHMQPYIDGRVEVFGGDFLRRYRMLTAPDVQTLRGELQNWNVQWTLLSPGNPAAAVLDILPGWCRRYADPVAVIHVRCGEGKQASHA